MERRPTREEIRELLRELWPFLPGTYGLPPVSERIARAEAEVDRLKKIVKKARR